MSEQFPHDGELIELHDIDFVSKGRNRFYHASTFFDSPIEGGKPIYRTITMNEKVAETFRLAGYTDVAWKFTFKKVDVKGVQVVLGVKNNKYCIVSVFAKDGTRYDVEPKPTSPVTVKPRSEPKLVEIPAKRFAHGEALNAWAKTNPYSLIEVDGEYELVIDYAKLAMMKEAS